MRPRCPIGVRISIFQHVFIVYFLAGQRKKEFFFMEVEKNSHIEYTKKGKD
jgi:hypothetical protein